MPQQVHFKIELQPSFFGRLIRHLSFQAFLGVAVLGVGEIFSDNETHWVHSFLWPFYIPAALALLGLTWHALRCRVVVTVLHKSTGAQVDLTVYRNGHISFQKRWSRLKQLIHENTASYDESESTNQIFGVFAIGKKKQLFTDQEYDFRGLDFGRVFGAIAAEVNRQQDGTWKKQPLVAANELDKPERDEAPG